LVCIHLGRLGGKRHPAGNDGNRTAARLERLVARNGGLELPLVSQARPVPISPGSVAGMRIQIARTGAALILALVPFCHPSVAATPAVVEVLLQDPSTDATVSSMRIAVDRDTVPAGRITFRARNQSKDQVHELIVVQIKPGQRALPYDERKAEVVESRIHRLGEIPDLKPGASGTMTLGLKPGSYLLICNQRRHYKAGMTASLAVSP